MGGGRSVSTPGGAWLRFTLPKCFPRAAEELAASKASASVVAAQSPFIFYEAIGFSPSCVLVCYHCYDYAMNGALAEGGPGARPLIELQENEGEYRTAILTKLPSCNGPKCLFNVY